MREAEEIGMSKDQAGRAFAELVERGFLRVGRESSFTLKTKAARTWRLTSESAGANAATKEFMRWLPSTETQKFKSRSHQCDAQSHQRDTSHPHEIIEPFSVASLRPSTPEQPDSRSHQCDTSNLPCGGDASPLSASATNSTLTALTSAIATEDR